MQFEPIFSAVAVKYVIEIAMERHYHGAKRKLFLTDRTRVAILEYGLLVEYRMQICP